MDRNQTWKLRVRAAQMRTVTEAIEVDDAVQELRNADALLRCLCATLPHFLSCPLLHLVRPLRRNRALQPGSPSAVSSPHAAVRHKAHLSYQCTLYAH